MKILDFLFHRGSNKIEDGVRDVIETERIDEHLVVVYMINSKTGQRSNSVKVRVATAGTYDRSAAFYDLRTYKGEPVF